MVDQDMQAALGVTCLKDKAFWLVNVAVIQWHLQPCAIQLNLGHVTGNITMEKIFCLKLYTLLWRELSLVPYMAFAWCCCQIDYVAHGGHKRLGC